MEILATEVKKLRDKTGAGMMECKRALQSAQGDHARAIKILKEQGLAAASKRADRATTQGRVFTALSPSTAACLEFLAETDFVAKNAGFKKTGEELTAYVRDQKPTEIDQAMKEMVAGIIAKIKENIVVRRFKVLSAGPNEFFTDYIHGEGRIAVIVKMQADKIEALTQPAVKELAFNIALHIAAFSPLYLSEEKIDAAYIKEQEEIFVKQAQALGKPENVTLGIAKGKLKKHFAEICLLDQNYVKDESRSVRQVIEETGKTVGAKLAVTDYLYMKMGVNLD